MEIKELLKLARSRHITKEGIEAFHKRQNEREKQFALAAKKMEITEEFLNRRYTI